MEDDGATKQQQQQQQQQQRRLVQAMPPPPHYYHNYSDLSTAPSPPTVIIGEYTMFGTPLNTKEPLVRPLSDQNVPQLYTNTCSFKTELKKLNNLLTLKFIDVLNALSSDPSTYEGCVADMDVLFANMHHLINVQRPHQATETFVSLVRDQVSKRRKLHQEAVDDVSNVSTRLRTVHDNIFTEAMSAYTTFKEESRTWIPANVGREKTDDAIATSNQALTTPMALFHASQKDAIAAAAAAAGDGC